MAYRILLDEARRGLDLLTLTDMLAERIEGKLFPQPKPSRRE